MNTNSVEEFYFFSYWPEATIFRFAQKDTLKFWSTAFKYTYHFRTGFLLGLFFKAPRSDILCSFGSFSCVGRELTGTFQFCFVFVFNK